jgi:hypothetical protein
MKKTAKQIEEMREAICKWHTSGGTSPIVATSDGASLQNFLNVMRELPRKKYTCAICGKKFSFESVQAQGN